MADRQTNQSDTTVGARVLRVQGSVWKYEGQNTHIDVAGDRNVFFICPDEKIMVLIIF